ncbi:type IV secretory system conjugative DNA transfer family protein [Clostridium hydrogenum]|uniref:type IV secretory system conjugative DNA transfer family protein n=1 Tax=Clostridium hydrogenum TaxID=2855764 RepID=UPI001F3913A1|nr:type IV secretory system conjugative DNA transfer family protein [Clostridium hydrogenum]
MDIYKEQPTTQLGLVSEAKAQKYAKIISTSIIESARFKGGGDNSCFYDSAEGIITSSILLIAEYGEKSERHIISVFKLIQLLPENHKAKWFAGAAVEADIKTALSVFATALSKLTKFIDSELEQILCFDGDFTAENFASQNTAVFVVLPEEDKTKYFLFSIFLMQLYCELLNIADEKFNCEALENSLKENHNMSMQMVGRPLMAPDEIKRIPKGEFVILKTGADPMKVNIPFYGEWGIELNDDFVPETRKIVVPQYISVRELKDKIVQEAIKESEEKEVEKKSLYDKLKRG